MLFYLRMEKDKLRIYNYRAGRLWEKKLLLNLFGRRGRRLSFPPSGTLVRGCVQELCSLLTHVEEFGAHIYVLAHP